MSQKIAIIGGGIIGLSSAFYLRKTGFEVTVIDRTAMEDGCSYGNAGYICPSHFIPLATPGIVKQGFKWMMNAKSPFYVEPRLDLSLIQWGMRFIRKANSRHVRESAIPLRDIAVLSKALYEDWLKQPCFDFAYRPAGLLEFFQTPEHAHHAEEVVAKAKNLGLDTALLAPEQVKELEPGLDFSIAGAIFFKDDAQSYPNRLMQNLKACLAEDGVRFIRQQQVDNFRVEGRKIICALTTAEEISADQFLLASGSWSRELAMKLKIRLPMVAGRGYSVTYEDLPYRFNHPVILNEAKVAISPMDGNKLRFGGTMEITAIGTPPRYKRVEGILHSVQRYFPGIQLKMPSKDRIWYGYRPCSADGLPYIGRSKKYDNLVIATGHSMLGLSLGAGTGKLVQEIFLEKTTSIDVSPFDVER